MAKTPHREKFKGEFLNQEQVQQLIELFKGTVLEIPVTLCAVFGFRRGETLGLKWKSVDMVNKTITISETLQQRVGGSYTAPPKTESSYRTLPIADNVFSLLQLHKAEQDKTRKILKAAYALFFGLSYDPMGFALKIQRRARWILIINLRSPFLPIMRIFSRDKALLF